MKQEFFIKKKIRIAFLVLFTLGLPVGIFATEPVIATRVIQDEGLKETAAESAQDTLKACLYRILFNLDLEQTKVAEENCKKDAAERAETLLTN